MKLLSLFLAVSIFAGSAMASHRPVRPGYPPPHRHDDGVVVLFATTSALLLLSISHEGANHRNSLMVEAAPLAADYLSTGVGLKNPALVAAMLAVREVNSSLSNDELALGVIEEANQ